MGFVGVAGRLFPLAMPAQSLWRLSSTLTYSDTAGLVAAIGLLLALASPRGKASRACVTLCAAGLLASQSRGALVAFAVGALLIPLRRYSAFAVPLIVGFAVGVVAVATSAGDGTVPWLLAVVVAAVAASMLADDRICSLIVRLRPRWVLPMALGTAALGAWTIRHQAALRALAPSDGDRKVEWSAAWHQFLSSPWTGVGPDRVLRFFAPDGTVAYFAHNEYLQIAADLGVVGLIAVGVIAVGLVTVVRRTDLRSSSAAAALACWAAGGAVDFSWHLPLIGLLGGAAAGIAAARST